MTKDKTVVSIDFDGKEYSIETGRFAKFANGAVMVKCGDTMVLVTATASETELENVDFLPLQVEYREKTAAAGKIPGGFLKREGRPSDNEVLTSRLIDRPTRPMIPKTWHFETQIIATVYSADPEVDADTLAAVGASASLMISDIPFAGPFSEVKIGRIEGQWIVNPSFEQLKISDIDLIVAGTDAAITMVEGETKEISEDEFIEALLFAHEKIKQLNDLQRQLADKVEVVKREYTELVQPEEFVQFIKDTISADMHEYVHAITTKKERGEARKAIREKAVEAVLEKYAEDEEMLPLAEGYAKDTVDKVEKEEMRKMILKDRKRLDGRKLDEIRPITCETGLLPRAHGSALFTRGETQSLTSVTLGTSRDTQTIDGLNPAYENNFFLHYNFPPFSTGEVKRLGVSRREVGHGNLAERALKNMIPSEEEFPYVMRVVSDVLESNGSSSMATVCAGSLALFDAGVPMKKAVAGIAMGLIKEEDDVAILSDILGDEDFLGDMDFKVTGTREGITACQMDIKIEGLSVEIMKEALAQAKKGRFHILDIMDEALTKPKEDLSRYAPRFTTMQVPTDTIGAVIGSGGENIRSIIRETDTEINIDDDGIVTIAATNQEAADRARELIMIAIEKPEEGKVYKGKVKEIREGLGAFVEFLPKKQGLLHISQLSWERTENIEDVVNVGDEVEVKLLEVTRDGKFRLSLKALQEKPEGYVERERAPRSDDRRGGDRRGGDRRGGDRRGGDRRGGSDDRRGGDRGDRRSGNR